MYSIVMPLRAFLAAPPATGAEETTWEPEKEDVTEKPATGDAAARAATAKNAAVDFMAVLAMVDGTMWWSRGSEAR